MTSRLPERAVMKFYKIKVFGGVSILKIVRLHSFTWALKTSDLHFQKYFQTKPM